MNNWSPLWSGIVDSSIWDEADYVVKVFVTMLALKDADHIVRLSAYQLAKRSRKTETEVLDALRILASPDTKRQEAQQYEGRRIEAVEEGWLVLNGQYYRDKISEEMKRRKNRRNQQAWRDRQKSIPLPGEQAYVRGVEAGTVDADTGEPVRTADPDFPEGEE